MYTACVDKRAFTALQSSLPMTGYDQSPACSSFDPALSAANQFLQEQDGTSLRRRSTGICIEGGFVQRARPAAARFAHMIEAGIPSISALHPIWAGGECFSSSAVERLARSQAEPFNCGAAKQRLDDAMNAPCPNHKCARRFLNAETRTPRARPTRAARSSEEGKSHI